ncbi:hypothetical protein JL720_7645 [Aureococcus anophagefferens]|nr:hypothetical protein JL720_7645 [Aureococcus anophagefferens]
MLAGDFPTYGAAVCASPSCSRFVLARPTLEEAADMWRKTHAWRALHVPRALEECGAFGDPAHGPCDGAPARPVARQYYPEVNSSNTAINAPMGVESLWRIVQLFIDENMRQKVRIVGRSYRGALVDHAKIADLAKLARRHGGDVPDAELARPARPSPGVPELVDADPTPPFLQDMVARVYRFRSNQRQGDGVLGDGEVAGARQRAEARRGRIRERAVERKVVRGAA